MSSKGQRRDSATNQIAKGDSNNKPTGRKSLLVDYVGKNVTVITNDGRNVVGFMKGFDQVCNIILEKCAERVFSVERGVSVIALGLYVIRGDNIAVVGELDVDKDANMAWNNVYGHIIKPVVH